LERLPLTLVAEDGAELPVDATWFLSEDWPGPMVIGWKGGLERMKFGIDPGDQSFYFGGL